jgi:hypothetical protein
VFEALNFNVSSYAMTDDRFWKMILHINDT